MRHYERGVALIELVVALPLLMLLMLGIVEVGRFAYFGIVVANAARAGAQYAAQSATTAGNSTGISSAVAADDANGVGTITASTTNEFCQCWNGSAYSNPTPNSCSGSCSTGHIVELVSVTATGTADSLFNYPFLPSSTHISSTATMRLFQQ
ncbi:MAG TPA: TadE/TadG family type IV pilus assembly protein [Candidatus Baltobacteraceae bacterium]|nr:TadE/TadG family type IV pilus assembly protein [Candidatus Baltobacteraceae bacterium]